MDYNFDTVADRRGTCSEKWDIKYPGWPEALPMWVADMDFAAPPEVSAAIVERVTHGVYGYTHPEEADFEAPVRWRQERCGHAIKPQWVLFSSGVVCSLKAVINALTKPGDAVVVQPPVYPPFMGMVERGGRRVVANPLRQDQGGRWGMDLDHLESCFKQGARLMFLCSSHNPVGRVWTPEELAGLAALCQRYDVVVASDEIHCDILRPGYRHTAIASLPGMEERVITLFSTTKSFNLAGVQNSVAVIADQTMQHQVAAELYRCNHDTPNLFGMIAQRAAWTHGGPWLDQMNHYVAQNCDKVLEMLAGQQAIVPTVPEATYLLWLDCRAISADERALVEFFASTCRVWPTMGKAYGAEGYVRLNLATSRAVVEEGVGRILEGLRTIGKL